MEPVKELKKDRYTVILKHYFSVYDYFVVRFFFLEPVEIAAFSPDKGLKYIVEIFSAITSSRFCRVFGGYVYQKELLRDKNVPLSTGT